MPKKEDRSDWVAVAPESKPDAASTEIRKATTAYQYFQRDISAQVKQELLAEFGAFDIAKHGRAVRDKWNALSEAEKERYYALQREDQARFAQESHLADVAAMERREKLQQERAQVLLDDEGGTSRTTRKKWSKKQRKKARKDEKHQVREKKKQDPDDSDFNEDEEDDESEGSWDSEDSTSSSEERRKRKKAPPRKLSQKQIENRAKSKAEKIEKEAYIAGRQEDLRKEKAAQAKRRLEFLLKQSNIFSHFGGVKEDQAKFGIKSNAAAAAKTTSSSSSNTPGSSRHTHAGDEDKEAALEEADEHEATFLTQQPSTLGFGKMRDYQLEGLNWMIRLQENGVNGILADEMGLGKTLQSISILVYMLEYRNMNGPHLIVVPKSTLSNWMIELTRWAPTLNAVKFHGDKATREDIVTTILEPGQRDEERDWHVVVTTYEVCNIEKNTLSKFAWSYLIIDEAHRLKNEASAFSKTVRQFETRYRILLTGTPLQNSLHELWALLNFLVPDVFASSEQFDEWFNLDIDDVNEKNKLISQLHKILRPFMLRRLKADVEKSLPPKHETILYTGLSAMQKKLYRDILTRDIEAINGTSGNRTAILNICMQLRKAAGHPYLFPGVEDRTLPPLGEHLVENCGKMVLLDKLLRRLQEKGHRVLLFTQMTRILDIMEDYLVMRRFKYCRIDGNTSYEDRENYIEAYNKPDSEKFLFLLSTRAGGLGINLQTADVVILYDSDWNPQADLQAQDRAHRIGQKRPVQVFRIVTEHTIEEKIVERAQQKLKLDAMVVQSGRLKDKDSKLSRNELIAAVKFGADKIFKSKDSSITDDDIDMILDAGKKKTQELNEKLQAAEKGDLLDFKIEGGSVQMFDGVDYSTSALNKARADAEILGIFDIGKRERKEANYNENTLYQRQMDALKNSASKPKKKKTIKLPKHLRLPRMEEFQMYDRESLIKIQEEEEAAFKALPEEVQKAASGKKEAEPVIAEEGEAKDVAEAKGEEETPPVSLELPPLLSDEKQAEKEKLLAEGFSAWKRHDYSQFVKASSRYGRDAFDKIAGEVGKKEDAVKEFAAAFWGDLGKSRIAEHEYDRVTKLIERGEKKIGEIKRLERATEVLVSHFENPWEELEFVHVNARDKLFTPTEDRHLLCWSRKYGYGQWAAIQHAIRSDKREFSCSYLFRSTPIDMIGRRCEQLMRHAEKEVEQLEKIAREEAGLPVESTTEGEPLPPIKLPKFHELQKQRRISQKIKAEKDRKELEGKVAEIDTQIKAAQARLKALNEGANAVRVSPDHEETSEKNNHGSRNLVSSSGIAPEAQGEAGKRAEKGAVGPDGNFKEFPEYDGSEPPAEWKKPFTHYCIRTRKAVKAKLDPEDRKNKKKVNRLLKEGWQDLSEDDKATFRGWTEWDKKRYARDLAIFERQKEDDPKGATAAEENYDDGLHVPKKRKKNVEDTDTLSIPKKRKA